MQGIRVEIEYKIEYIQKRYFKIPMQGIQVKKKPVKEQVGGW